MILRFRKNRETKNLEIFDSYTIEKPRDLKCENLISSKLEALKILQEYRRMHVSEL